MFLMWFLLYTFHSSFCFFAAGILLLSHSSAATPPQSQWSLQVDRSLHGTAACILINIDSNRCTLSWYEHHRVSNGFTSEKALYIAALTVPLCQFLPCRWMWISQPRSATCSINSRAALMTITQMRMPVVWNWLWPLCTATTGYILHITSDLPVWIFPMVSLCQYQLSVAKVQNVYIALQQRWQSH